MFLYGFLLCQCIGARLQISPCSGFFADDGGTMGLQQGDHGLIRIGDGQVKRLLAHERQTVGIGTIGGGGQQGLCGFILSGLYGMV